MFGQHATDAPVDQYPAVREEQLGSPAHKASDPVLAVGTPVIVLPPIPEPIQMLASVTGIGEEELLAYYIEAQMRNGVAVGAVEGILLDGDAYDVRLYKATGESTVLPALWVGEGSLSEPELPEELDPAAQAAASAVLDGQKHPVLIGIPEENEPALRADVAQHNASYAQEAEEEQKPETD